MIIPVSVPEQGLRKRKTIHIRFGALSLAEGMIGILRGFEALN